MMAMAIAMPDYGQTGSYSWPEVGIGAVISALGIGPGRVTGNPEVISSPVGLVPTGFWEVGRPTGQSHSEV
jgi:hypothetical protein